MKKKERTITFKTDETLAEVLDRIPNKSEFIRNAIEVALKYKCPLCHGRGVLTREQSKHLQSFLTRHNLEKCDKCDAVYFTCDTGTDTGGHHA